MLIMKHLFLSLSRLALTACSHAVPPEVPEVLEVAHEKLVERDGVTYEIDFDEPFTGRSVKYHENGNLKNRTDYVDGKKNGISEWFWENGVLGQRGHLKNGKLDGLLEVFYQNGKLQRSVIYKNGVKVD